MPAVSPSRLVRAIMDAIADSGRSGALISAARSHPRKFVITDGAGPTSLWVYAWTLTFGGRPSLPDEFRIQMTSVTSPLDINPNGLTVLIGYDPDLNVFGGFDLRKHMTFTTGSPSVQIDKRTLFKALQDGMAFASKDNDEITVAFRPDQFVAYAQNAPTLHQYGTNKEVLTVLNKATERQDSPRDITAFSESRKKIVQTISRLSRDSSFRQQVLQAYDNRCAMTRTQLKLVDAAHILPVGAPGSIDSVTNGLALSPTYHRAYDAGLIYLDKNYQMKANPEREVELTALKLHAGLASFKSTLGAIHLPPDKHQWPDPALIKKANEFRMVPS